MTKNQLIKCLTDKSGIIKDLRGLASDMHVRGYDKMHKSELIEKTVGKATNSNGFLGKLKKLAV